MQEEVAQMSIVYPPAAVTSFSIHAYVLILEEVIKRK